MSVVNHSLWFLWTLSTMFTYLLNQNITTNYIYSVVQFVYSCGIRLTRSGQLTLDSWNRKSPEHKSCPEQLHTSACHAQHTVFTDGLHCCTEAQSNKYSTFLLHKDTSYIPGSKPLRLCQRCRTSISMDATQTVLSSFRLFCPLSMCLHEISAFTWQ